MNLRALLIGAVATLAAAVAFAAPPLAGSWSITPSGSAASSGELLFRVVGERAGARPVDVRVVVKAGSNDVAVAHAIREALRAAHPVIEVQVGEGANVLVSDPHGKPTFSVEMVESNIDGLRISVRAIEPAASPTIPSQEVPATPQPPPTPGEPGAPANAPPPRR